jgi:hypothetical protein
MTIQDQLRILYMTEGYTPHALAAHPRVLETVRRQTNGTDEHLI